MTTTEFKVSDAAALLGVSNDTLRRWAEAGRVQIARSTSGRQVVPGVELAALAQSLAAEQQLGGSPAVSARNRMRGVVTRVVRDTVMAQVEMQAGPFRIVSLMSREAADELGLEAGVLAVANVKATNVVVEVP